MKPVIMTISGSPRKDGVSNEMLRRFTGFIDADFRSYDAYLSSFAPCIDCRYCRQSEGCSIDDMDEFFSVFESADGIVIASPVYNMSFPAPMKVIIDRMQRYYSARFFLGKRPPIAKRRPVALLLSAGSPEENGGLISRQLAQAFSVTNCEIICSVVRSNTDNTSLQIDNDLQIRRSADKFAAEIR